MRSIVSDYYGVINSNYEELIAKVMGQLVLDVSYSNGARGIAIQDSHAYFTVPPASALTKDAVISRCQACLSTASSLDYHIMVNTTTTVRARSLRILYDARVDTTTLASGYTRSTLVGGVALSSAELQGIITYLQNDDGSNQPATSAQDSQPEPADDPGTPVAEAQKPVLTHEICEEHCKWKHALYSAAGLDPGFNTLNQDDYIEDKTVFDKDNCFGSCPWREALYVYLGLM